MTVIRLPGMIDVHTHLRQPGLEHKEDFASGTRAALAGGITMVLDMPNTVPPTSTPEAIQHKSALASQWSVCDVGLFAGATHQDIGAYLPLAEKVCGLKVYVNETFGSLRIDSLEALHEIFRGWAEVGQQRGYRTNNAGAPSHFTSDWSARRIGPIAVHAEEMMVPVCITLATLYDVPLHVVHVSRRSEIEVIRRAKERGWAVTCEVTPHHLLLTEATAQRLGALADMRPQLASPDDVKALWENMEYIDVFATDHAPHTLSEKQSTSPPPGIPGLESMLPLLITQVHEGRLELDDIVKRCYERPRSIYGLPEQQDTYIVVDVDAQYSIDPTRWQTKARWSPFAGCQVRGRIEQVVIRGQEVVSDSLLHADQFQGKLLFV